MANRVFAPSKGFLEKGMVKLWLTINTGSSGAVSSFVGKGIKTVVRNSAGNYTITFQDNFARYLDSGASVRGTASTGTPTAAKSSTVNVYNVAVGSGATPASCNLQCLRSDTIAAADVTDNWFIDCEFTFADTVLA